MAQLIGRYEVIRVLGHGGMATVFLAHDPLMHRQIALKVLPREFLHDPSFRARFEREVKALAALEHPAIVPVHDFGEADGQLYLVMRYLPGGALSERIVAGPLALPDVTRIVWRLADALDEVHAQGMIHRDLKPSNILFDARGDAYLADFGIAKLTQTSAALTRTGIIGTPEYMSPEQARGEKGLDGRSDVYSLGIVLFQSLTGVLPFEADTPIGTAMRHVTDPVPSILALRPDLPRACDAVIARVLAKSPSARYQTVSELAAALAALAAPHAGALSAVTPTPPESDSHSGPGFTARHESQETIVEPQPSPDAPPSPGTEQLPRVEPTPQAFLIQPPSRRSALPGLPGGEILEDEGLDAERRRVERYGVEVVVCSNCGAINSLSFSRCIKCSKDLSKEKPVSNPYLPEERERSHAAKADSSRRQRQYDRQPKVESEAQRQREEQEPQPGANIVQESQEAEKRRVEGYGIEIAICSSCGAKNSLSFSRCLRCSKDLSREKPVANPYL